MNSRDQGDVAATLDAACRALGDALGLDRREARLEARVLAAFAWEVTPSWLIAHDTGPLTTGQIARFQGLLTRRLAGEPIAHITGRREFFSREFSVTPDVLIPRPETEWLVERALARIPSDKPLDVLDLGTGSGAIAITLALERPLARVTAVDCSGAALAIARENAATLGAVVKFLASDWFGAFMPSRVFAGRRFDCIVANPPYVASDDPHLAALRFEPRAALAAGPSGLDDLARIIAMAPAYLAPDGWLMLEHGYDQGEAVRRLLSSAGFDTIETWQDLAGCDRVSGGKCRKTLHSHIEQSD